MLNRQDKKSCTRIVSEKKRMTLLVSELEVSKIETDLPVPQSSHSRPNISFRGATNFTVNFNI